jgi:uncharacterized protein (DUF433 family)/transposase
MISAMDVTLLERELYTEREAARLLGVSQSTLHYWLDGSNRDGRDYSPILRATPTNGLVTWGEFVEAALLREYRRTHGVPMAQLRGFIEMLRQKFGVPHPLAHARPLVSGRDLVIAAQEETNLDANLCLVAVANGQLILTSLGSEFSQRVTWEGDIAASWRPHDDPGSLVRIDPQMRFGRPSVGGISTEVLCEHDISGSDPDEIAATFGLSPAQVAWALAFESTTRAA